jgi:hypothetical protein
VNFIDRVYCELSEAIERNEWALIRWGKRWNECSEAEQAEAQRLRETSFGSGYVAREV